MRLPGPGFLKFVASSRYTDPRLGEVCLTVRSQARRITARWKGRVLTVSVPERTLYSRFEQIMLEWTPQLLASKPKPRFYPGLKLEFEAFTLEFLEDGIAGECTVTGGGGHYTLHAGPDRLGTPECEKTVDTLIKRICTALYRRHVEPIASRVCADLGVEPMLVKKSHGYRRLGYCTARGEVHLSAALVLLPAHLRRYVVCHELAHLSEMNHGPRFHALVNEYTGGREAELEKELRAFSWPVAR